MPDPRDRTEVPRATPRPALSRTSAGAATPPPAPRDPRSRSAPGGTSTSLGLPPPAPHDQPRSRPAISPTSAATTATHRSTRRAFFLAAYQPTDDPIEAARRLLVRSHLGHGGEAVANGGAKRLEALWLSRRPQDLFS